MAEQQYAIITNGIVANVLVADGNFIAIHYPGAIRIDTLAPIPGVGWAYANGQFTAPTPTPAPTVAVTSFTKFGFRSLFTLAELIAIDNYASNSTLSTTQLQTLNTITKNFDVAETIDLADPATQYGVNYLASCGLITTQRAAVILAGQSPS